MGIEQRIAELIEPSLKDLGFDLVRVQHNKDTLQIMAEPADGAVEMTVEHCAEISRTVSALLDVADPIKDQYTLEVSSPGIDRPLTRLSDYERFAGEPARVDLIAPFAGEPCHGQKRFSGVLSGANGDSIRLELEDEGIVELPFAGISRARLDISANLTPSNPTGQKKKTQEKGE